MHDISKKIYVRQKDRLVILAPLIFLGNFQWLVTPLKK